MGPVGPGPPNFRGPRTTQLYGGAEYRINGEFFT